MRIWPLHIVTLAAFYVLLYDPAVRYGDLGKVWANVLLLHAWLGNYVYVFNGNSVSWTLSVELAFYLLLPLLIVLSDRSVVLVLVVVSAATIAWATAIWSPEALPLSQDMTTGIAVIRTHPGSYLVQFAAGMLAGRLFSRRDWTRLPSAAATSLEIPRRGLVRISYFLKNDGIFYYFGWRTGTNAATQFWLMHAWGMIFFLPVIFMLAIGRGRVSALLRNRVLVFLGEISFRHLYVPPDHHQPCLQARFPVTVDHDSGRSRHKCGVGGALSRRRAPGAEEPARRN